ncbi:MAG: hypothetical protein Q8P41_11095 [Pseudomonadota bacterium]|nr:hypothetical protein [Pseudomonadota bacterium]
MHFVERQGGDGQVQLAPKRRQCLLPRSAFQLLPPHERHPVPRQLGEEELGVGGRVRWRGAAVEEHVRQPRGDPEARTVWRSLRHRFVGGCREPREFPDPDEQLAASPAAEAGRNRALGRPGPGVVAICHLTVNK